MREIKTKDVFALARIIKKTNLKDSIKNIDLTQKVESIGIEMMLTILESSADAEKEIYALIEDIAEVDNLGDKPFEEFINVVSQIGEKNDLKAFFVRATRSTT